MAFFLLVGWSVLFQGTVSAEEANNNSEQVTATDKNHVVYLSLGDEHDSPLKEGQEIFDCTDKIFAVLELSNYPEGKHQFTALWTDPSDSVRERTQYDFHVRNDNTRLWAWLSLSRGFGSGMLQWVNPAAGLEDFIGLWEIEIKVDGKTIDKTNFEVSC